MAKQQIEWSVSELIHLKRFCNNISITKDVITLFLDMLISNAKSRTGISAEDIKKYNKEFYDYLNEYFDKNEFLDARDDSEEFKKLCLLFKVPILKNNLRSDEKMNLNGPIKNTPESEQASVSVTHLDCLDLFNNLSTTEKIKFIMEFQNAQIKLTPSEILGIKSL